jgi:hypothetical protein
MSSAMWHTLLPDADHEGVADDGKCGEEPLKLIDELKPESEEQRGDDEAKTPADKEDMHIEEGDAKNEGGELSVDVHRESKYSVLLNNCRNYSQTVTTC